MDSLTSLIFSQFIPMKKETITESPEFTCVRMALRKIGYKMTKPAHKNANGTDVFGVCDTHVVSVEVARATPVRGKRVLRVRPITRKQDDLIAIVLPSGYVLLEPMLDHCRLCNKSGDRYLLY